MNSKDLIYSALIVLLIFLSTSGSAAELTVCPSGCGYTKIQDAIDSAAPGDTVIVGDGTYTENVRVYKSLTIRAENGADSTLVQAADSGESVFKVTSAHVSISGFTITGASESGFAGLYVTADYCDLFNNTISNNSHGIYLDYSSSNNTITGNTISNNWDGIYLYASSSNTITSNTISDNDDGIDIWYSSSNNTITGNTFVNDGLFIYTSYQNSITDNAVNGKPLIYLEGVSDTTVTDAGQVILVRCSNITVNGLTLSNTSVGLELSETNNSIVSNNTISNNGDGIHLSDSSSNTITSNTISDNDDGIDIWYSSSNTITSNTINSNNFYGIYHCTSSSNTITSNTISNNYYGIALLDSSSNTITSNTINSNNWYGIRLYDSSSNNTLNSNQVCSNTESDFYLSGATGNSGGNNTCDNAGDWNDEGTTGCTYSCGVKGDSNGDGVVSDFELLSYIDQWVQGEVTDFDVLEAIDNWAS